MTKRKYNFWIKFNNNAISIDCQVSEVCQFINILFKDLLISDQYSLPILKHYLIYFDEGKQSIITESQNCIISSQSNKNPVEVANELMNIIKLEFLSPIKNTLVLHSALVSYSGKSILLPGASGNGKSLITLGLMLLGCVYHTDEVVLHNPKDDTLTPFARPLMVKPNGIKAVREMLGQSFETQIVKGETVYSLPIRELYQHFGTHTLDDHVSKDSLLHSPPPIQTIIFPNYDTKSTGEIVTLSSAQTVLELFKNNVVARNLPDLGMTSLKQLVQKTQGIKLNYGGYSQLPSLFKEIQTI